MFLACSNSRRPSCSASSITAKAARGAPVKAILPMKRCSALAVLLAPAFEKCVTDKIAMQVRSAISLRGSRTPRTSLFL